MKTIDCYVHVTGQASDPDDEGVQGFYKIEVELAQPGKHENPESLTALEKSEIATAVLNSFHWHQGIEVLDDFEIKAFLAEGSEIAEDDTHDLRDVVVIKAVYQEKVDDSDLPFTPGKKAVKASP